LLVLLVFFVAAAYPTPDINEAHYLGKAKHYWDPAWAAGDFFLQSRDAHIVFYWIFGWLTKFLSLSATAWTGRVVCWSLLAWAWVRLVNVVTARPLAAVLAAALWLATTQWFDLAGEWVVGGLEAKPLAYVLVLLGLEALVGGRWNRVWWLLGGAAAIHVLVGGWSVVLAGVVWLAEGRRRPGLSKMLPALAGGFALSLLGLVPALRLNVGASAAVSAEAAKIYVYFRLPHHLSLATLPAAERWEHYAMHFWLVGAFTAACSLTPAGPRRRRLRRFVWGAVAIAALGLVIDFSTRSHPTIGARLLRYYWFRLSDVAVPLGTAITIVHGLSILHARRAALANWLTTAFSVWALWYLTLVVANRHIDPRPPSDRKMARYDDWADVCEWVNESISPGSRFLTPRESQTFTWRTGMPQVVCYKNIPQDAEGIVQWRQRIDDVYFSHTSATARPYDSLAEMGETKLLELGEKYQADFVLTEGRQVLRLPLMYSNGAYAVYRLAPNRR